MLPTAEQGMWCFVLVHNDTWQHYRKPVRAGVPGGRRRRDIGLAPWLCSPLNILPPDAALPLMVYFPPVIPADARPQVRVLTGIHLEPGDERYLPATLHNTLSQVDRSGRSALVSGTLRLPENVAAAGLVWVAAVAYDDSGRVVGARRWESTAG
jgi:hypothetical protein